MASPGGNAGVLADNGRPRRERVGGDHVVGRGAETDVVDVLGKVSGAAQALGEPGRQLRIDKEAKRHAASTMR